MRLRMVPVTSPDAAISEVWEVQKTTTPAARHSICQLMNQMPDLTGPIRAMTKGASQVAEISKATEMVRAMAIWNEL